MEAIAGMQNITGALPKNRSNRGGKESGATKERQIKSSG